MRAENSRGKLDPRRIDPTSLFGIVYIFGAFIYLRVCVGVHVFFFFSHFVCVRSRALLFRIMKRYCDAKLYVLKNMSWHAFGVKSQGCNKVFRICT